MENNDDFLGNIEVEAFDAEILNESVEEGIVANESVDDLEVLLERFDNENEDSNQNANNKPKLSGNKIVSKIVAVAVGIVIGVGGTLGVQNLPGFINKINPQNSYIMTFEGNKVNAEEYKLFQWKVKSDDAAMQIITQSLITLSKVKEYNLELSESDKTYWTEKVTAFKSEIEESGKKAPKITDDRMIELLAAFPAEQADLYGNLNPEYEYTYQSKLHEAVLGEMEISPEDYSDIYDRYYIMVQQRYSDINLNCLLTMSKATIDEAVAAIDAGMTFAEAFDTYHERMTFGPESGPMIMPISSIMFDKKGFDEILALPAGGITSVIDFSADANELYALFQVESANYVPNEAESNAFFEDEIKFIYDGEKGYYNEKLTQWTTDADYTINQKGLDYVNSLKLYY